MSEVASLVSLVCMHVGEEQTVRLLLPDMDKFFAQLALFSVPTTGRTIEQFHVWWVWERGDDWCLGHRGTTERVLEEPTETRALERVGTIRSSESAT